MMPEKMMGSGPMAGGDMGAGGGPEICVPLRAVSMAAESGEDVQPGEGDAVTLTIEGKVDRVEGDRAYVRAEKCNGEAMPTEGGEAEEAGEPAEEGAGIKADLEKEEGGY